MLWQTATNPGKYVKFGHIELSSGAVTNVVDCKGIPARYFTEGRRDIFNMMQRYFVIRLVLHILLPLPKPLLTLCLLPIVRLTKTQTLRM